MRQHRGAPTAPTARDGPAILPARMTISQLRSLANPRAVYPPFRESFFFDPRANTALKRGGRPPDRVHYAKESRRMWTTQGPSIDPRLPRTTIKPGTAFRNECLSADQLYSSSRNSLGYDVHRSLRGTSLCSTTKRFTNKAPTPEGVGPGSYDVTKKPRGLLTAPPQRQEGGFPPPDRLMQWGGRPDSRSMDSAGEWQFTSEKPSATQFSFRKARASTWIEQVEQRQRRENPLARREIDLSVTVSPEQRLPHFLQGTSNPVNTFRASSPAAGRVVQSVSVSLYPQEDHEDKV